MLIGVSMLSSVVCAETAWEAYLESPTPENAARVQHVEYADPASLADRLYEDLWLLEIQVTSADLEAVRLAFRLLLEADGHYGETLDIMLGRLIRIDPELFLQELKSRRKQVPRLDSLVGNFGDPYVDRLSAQQYEGERRIAALMSVSDSTLTEIRDECVAELQDRVALLEGHD